VTLARAVAVGYLFRWWAARQRRERRPGERLRRLEPGPKWPPRWTSGPVASQPL